MSYPEPPAPRESVRRERGLSGRSHMFHLMLTIVTCGLWGVLVWGPLWVFRLIVKRKIRTEHRY